jgi:hypothetical protein
VLLGAVMEVALDRLALGVGGRDDPGARSLELVDELGVVLAQRLALAEPGDHRVEAVGERPELVGRGDGDRDIQVPGANRLGAAEEITRRPQHGEAYHRRQRKGERGDEPDREREVDDPLTVGVAAVGEQHRHVEAGQEDKRHEAGEDLWAERDPSRIPGALA